MKKRILLFTAIAGMCTLALSSYLSGPGTNGYNCTGSETGLGNPTGCTTGGGCHANSATANIAVVLTLDSAGVAKTHYKPGMTYYIKISGKNNGATTLPKYGFQVGVIKGTAAAVTPVNAGTLQSTGLPAGRHYVAGPGSPSFVVNVIEESTPLAATTGTGGNGTTYVDSFTWVAPAAGTGSVSIWGVVNACNGNNNNDVNDLWNTNHVTITEWPTVSVATVSNDMSVTAYPNPLTTNLHVQLDNAQAGAYSLQVFDMSGRIVANENVMVVGVSSTTNINTGNWAIGTYQVVLQKDGFRKTISVVKR